MKNRILAGLLLAMALPALTLMALGAAGPEIAGDLGRLDQIAWLFVSYQVALVVSVPVYGKLGDIHGRRMVFLGSVAVFTLASLLAGLAWSFPMLIASRVLQGIGGGGIMSQTHAVIADLVPARERGRYSWLTPTVWTIASFLGPVFGGVVAEHAGWRWVFLVNIPLGLLSIWFVVGAFPRRSGEVVRSFDAIGSTLLVVSYGSIVFLLSLGGDVLEWRHPLVIYGLLSGTLLLVAFVVYEMRTEEPVMPLRFLRIPVIRASSITTFLIGTVNFMVVAFLPLMLQVVTGVGAAEAGFALVPTTFGIAITSTIVGRLVVRTGHYRIWPAVGSAIFATGYFVLANLGPDPSTVIVWVGTACLGLGMGAGSPVFMLSMQNAAPQRDVGAVSAMAVFARNSGQAFGVALAGAIFVGRLSHHLDRLVPADRITGVAVEDLRSDIDVIRSLPPDVERLVAESFRLAASDVFTLAAWGGVASLIASLAIQQLPLAETIEDDETPTASVSPTSGRE